MDNPQPFFVIINALSTHVDRAKTFEGGARAIQRVTRNFTIPIEQFTIIRVMPDGRAWFIKIDPEQDILQQLKDYDEGINE